MDYFLRLFGQFFASALPALHVVLILCAVFILAGCSNSSDNANGGSAPSTRPLIAVIEFADENLGSCNATTNAENGWLYVDEVTELAGLTDLVELSIEGTENDAVKYGRIRIPVRWWEGGLGNLVSLKAWRQSTGIADISTLTALTRLEVMYLEVSSEAGTYLPCQLSIT